MKVFLLIFSLNYLPPPSKLFVHSILFLFSHDISYSYERILMKRSGMVSHVPRTIRRCEQSGYFFMNPGSFWMILYYCYIIVISAIKLSRSCAPYWVPSSFWIKQSGSNINRRSLRPNIALHGDIGAVSEQQGVSIWRLHVRCTVFVEKSKCRYILAMTISIEFWFTNSLLTTVNL